MKTRSSLVIILVASIVLVGLLEPGNTIAQSPAQYKIIEGIQIVAEKLAANDLSGLGSTVFEFMVTYFGAKMTPGDKDGSTTIYFSPLSPVSPISPLSPLIARFTYTQQTFPNQVFPTTDGPKRGIDRFFRLQATLNNKPIPSSIFYSPIGVIVVRYTDQDIASVFESPLKLYWLHGNTWVATGIKTIIQKNHTLTSTVSNFFTDTLYAVLGEGKGFNIYLPVVLKQR